MSKIDLFKGFEILFYSENENRMHVHIRNNQCKVVAKVWLEPEVEFTYSKLKEHEETAILKHVRKNAETYRKAWREHHGK